jgi:hypothetical protein
MKKLLVLAVLSILVMLLPVITSACSSDRTTAALGEEFTLPVGQSVSIEGERLTIKFVEVAGDSRCAKGAECVWAGEVTCMMLIKYLDSSSSLEFVQGGGTNNTFQEFNVYQIVFNVEPYPELNKTIDPGDYRMVMKVNKPTK